MKLSKEQIEISERKQLEEELHKAKREVEIWAKRITYTQWLEKEVPARQDKIALMELDIKSRSSTNKMQSTTHSKCCIMF